MIFLAFRSASLLEIDNFKDAEFESGMHLLRLTIREGTRITIADIHPQAALEMGKAMIKWAQDHEQ